MSEFQTLVSTWERMSLDQTEAFEGIEDEHLHRRPAPEAPSISEIAAHIAYDDALLFLGTILGLPIEKWGIDSPFIDERYQYPPHFLSSPIKQELLSMNSTQIRDELQRVKDFIKEQLRNVDAPIDKALQTSWGATRTVWEIATYAIYHTAYHMGQIYLTRHIFGEKTPEN